MKSLTTGVIAIGALTGVLIARPPWPAPTRTATANAAERALHADHTQRAFRGIELQPSTGPADRRGKLIRDLEAALVSVDDRERERALGESLPQLMAIDPSAAAPILEHTPQGPIRDELRDRIARLWAAANLDGALQWVTTLEDDDDRRLATTAMRSQIAASDPATAIEISDLMDVGRDDGALTHVAQMWAEEDPSAAVAWAESQPPGPLRDELLARIALVVARSNPTAAR